MHEKIIEAEYKKTGIKPSDIAVLRQWVLTQPHLPAEYITDLDLILTYHSCEQSIEVAKQVLDLNLTLRTLFTNVFGNRNVDEKLVKILKTFVFVRLPVPSEQGTYLYYRLGQEASNYDSSEIIRASMMMLDLWQYEDGTWPGVILLVDLSQCTLAHFARSNLHATRNMFYYLQEALYMKLKGLHFVNIPTLMDKVITLIRPFLKKELLDIIRVHQTGSKTIEDIVPIEALPKELSGKYKSFEDIQNETIANFLENKTFFANECKKRVNEKLRPGKPKTLTDIFGGVEGSFKKLDID